MYERVDRFGLDDDEISFDDLPDVAPGPGQPHVMTVLGPVHPDELGVTLPHEHLLSCPPATVDDEPDFRTDDRHAGLADAEAFSFAGGGTIVDCTTPDNGRDPEGLRWIAERVAPKIICVTGFHMARHSAHLLEKSDPESVVAELVDDLTVGTRTGGVRAGLLKAGTSLSVIHPTERLALQSVAIAHRRTGVPITTHTEAGTMAGEQLAILRDGGVDPRHIIIGHLDRRFRDRSLLLDVLRSGVFVEFDQLGKPAHGPDEPKADVIVDLVRAGYGPQLLLSHDIARRSLRPSYGGAPGLVYMLDRFALMLMEKGLGARDVRQLMVDNPARALTIAPPGAT